MAYLSLYRRRRPLLFSSMTGQEHVVRTLSHALARGQLAHAYLFCGPRGTGKTTTAKIFARAVNCKNFPAPEPCGECPSCINIAAGVSLDVVEMDAASNRGIDEIRELRERTRYAGSDSRFKVFIIDEAHMLTKEACNAFLKTLEEPPPGVIFILATTDPANLPATIISRCQRFDFHLLRVDQIMSSLQQTVELEQWQVEEEALRLISRLAEGSMRDALGLLEQCQAYGEEVVTAEHVRMVTGVTRVDTIQALIEALAKADLAEGINILQQVIYSGRDLHLLIRDLTFFFSRLLLRGSGESSRLEEAFYGFNEILEQYRDRFPFAVLLDLVALLHQVSGELRHTHNPQFAMEVAFIRMLRLLYGGREQASLDTPLPAGQDKGMPEEYPAGTGAGTVSGSGESAQSEPASPKPAPAINTSPREISLRKAAAQKKVGAKKALPAASSLAGQDPAKRAAARALSADECERLWPRILQEMKRKKSSTHEYLIAAHAHEWGDGLLILRYSREDCRQALAAARIDREDHRRPLEEVLQKMCGRPIRMKVGFTDAPASDPGAAGAETAAASADAAMAGALGAAERAGEDDLVFDEVVKMFDGQVVETEVEEES